jgi:hypothetical protein
MDNIQEKLDDLLLQHIALEGDFEDLLFVMSEILGIIGITMSDLKEFDDKVMGRVFKSINGLIFDSTSDPYSFAMKFASFGPIAIRLAEKYEQKIQEVIDERK